MIIEESQPANSDEKKVLVTFLSQSNYTISFKIYSDTLLHRVGRSFAKYADLSPGGMRLMYDGQRFEPNATPKSLGLADNEVIEVYQEQLSG
uniref:Ubiquitin-like domain-containing protein n=1 Tax=Caenorhabditis tropicalis TaxID=1561998 RepID=A0A1I7US09_9PELO